MSKSYRELKEWVNINEAGGWVGMGVPDLDTGRAIQAVDDVDTAAFNVPDESVVEKLNAFLHTLCQKQFINPYYILNDIWKKLMIVGLHFNMREVAFPGNQGRSTVPVTQYGGRHGVLGDPGSYVSQDDGTRIPGGLSLVITFQKTGGVYTLDAHLERGVEHVPFVEGTSVTEGKRSDPYEGPFPRKKHSHKCAGCATRIGQTNAVACYKQHCTRPQHTETCSWCRDSMPTATNGFNKLKADREVGATDPVTEAAAAPAPYHTAYTKAKEHPFHATVLKHGFNHLASHEQKDKFGTVERHEYLHPKHGNVSLIKTDTKGFDGPAHAWEHRPKDLENGKQRVYMGRTAPDLSAHLQGSRITNALKKK